MSSSERSGGVIKNLAAASNLNGQPAKCAHDLPRQTNGCRVAFDGKNFAFERRDRDSAKGLQRMHGTNGRAVVVDSFKRAGVQSAASVQHDFAAQFLRANSSQLFSNFYDRIIRSGYQDQP